MLASSRTLLSRSLSPSGYHKLSEWLQYCELKSDEQVVTETTKNVRNGMCFTAPRGYEAECFEPLPELARSAEFEYSKKVFICEYSQPPIGLSQHGFVMRDPCLL